MKISVIIPAFNSAKSLEVAIQSVLEQTHTDFELIVMDGGSKDGTHELLQRYNEKLTYWQSQKDNGTTDAMNSGYKKATGELITFLCSDDRFHDAQVFEKVVSTFKMQPDTDVLCPAIKVVDPEGYVHTYVSQSNPDRLYLHMSAHLPGAFFKRSILRSQPFDLSVEVANDYELFAYLQKQKKPIMRVSDIIAVTFSLGGRTNDPKTDFWKAQECFFIRRKYYGFWAAWVPYLWDLSVASARKAHIRPFRWVRKARRFVKGPLTASSDI